METSASLLLHHMGSGAIDHLLRRKVERLCTEFVPANGWIFGLSFWILSLCVLLCRGVVEGDLCKYPQSCGSVSVQYPFSVYEACGLPSFRLECRPNNSLGYGSFAYLDTPSGSFQVLDISSGGLLVNFTDMKAEIDCSHVDVIPKRTFLLNNYPAQFAMSGENYFSVFQCNIGAFNTDYIESPDFESVVTPQPRLGFGLCATDCHNTVQNPICQNKKCCVSPLPNGARTVSYQAQAEPTNTTNQCGGFSILFYPHAPTDWSSTYSLKLLWALPYNESSQESDIKSDPTYACGPNSRPDYISGVPGYVCTCLTGYEGDGFLNGVGCKDVDECMDASLNRCVPRRGKCHNTPGNYTCACRFGVGDGYKDRKGCNIPDSWLIAGILGGVATLTMIVVLGLYTWRRRKLHSKKRKNFVQNGGLQLQLFISCSGGRETARLFSIQELNTATRNFAHHMQLGSGGYGTVFKGILDDGRAVAIKKANRKCKEGTEQFLNEIAIITQINHRHIVSLLGCCLETEVPLLVFEYIPNGNLAQYLRGCPNKTTMDWSKRLQISIQASEALSYLHSAALPPILHRDVKSSNILLDENLDVKVADFGVSRLVPIGHNHVSTLVKGTIGYLDPEYFQSFQLTDKSDVYSFGVVLAELITGLKPIDNKREPRNLALLFLYSLQEGGIDDIVDLRLEAHAKPEVMMSVKRVAQLAGMCLALQGRNRPSMKEVVEDLHGIRNSRRGLMPLDKLSEEAKPLLL